MVETKFLRRPQVEQLTGLSRSSIYAAMEAGQFPKPIRITPGRVAWLESEVRAWMADRISRSREAA